MSQHTLYNLLKPLCIAGGIISAGMVGTGWSATLDAELSRLMAEHPKLVAARQTALAAGAELESAKDAYFPTLSVNGNTGQDRYQDTFRTGEETIELTREKATVELTQNLFSGFQSKAMVGESQSKQKLANHGITQVEQELLLQGVLAYIEVLRYSKMRAMTDDKVRVARRYLSLKERGRKTGGGTNIEVFEARLGLQRALEKQLDIDTRYRIASRKYEELFEHPPEPGEMTEPAIPSGIIPDSLEQAMELNKSRNMAMAMAEERISLARHRKGNVAGEYWPRVDLKGMYDYEKNKQGIEGITRETYVFLNMSWNFNLANQTGSKVRSASERVVAEQYSYDATVKEEVNRVHQAWDKYQAMSRRKALSAETLAIALDVLKARNELRQRGKGNEGNVLSATAKMLTSKLADADAGLATDKAAYELAFTVGMLGPVELGL